MGNGYPPATLFGTHARKLASAIVGREYEVSVWLPLDYDASPDKPYPVLYILDADVSFGMAAHMVWMMVAGGDIPPMIVVGVGWGIQGWDDWNVQRDRDYLPVAVEFLPGSEEGGAGRFLSFLDTELIPFINSEYRVNSGKQYIWGHSASGLLATYALLQKPGLFHGIVAGSPAIWICSALITELEEQLAQSGKPLHTLLYMAFGALEGEWVKPAEDFYHTLVRRNYVGLTAKYELLDGETHTSAIAPLFIKGLREIMKMEASPTG